MNLSYPNLCIIGRPLLSLLGSEERKRTFSLLTTTSTSVFLGGVPPRKTGRSLCVGNKKSGRPGRLRRCSIYFPQDTPYPGIVLLPEASWLKLPFSSCPPLRRSEGHTSALQSPVHL